MAWHTLLQGDGAREFLTALGGAHRVGSRCMPALKTVWDKQFALARFGSLDAGRHGEAAPLMQRLLQARTEVFPPAQSFLTHLASTPSAPTLKRTLIAAVPDGAAYTWAINLAKSPRCGATVAFTIDPAQPDLVRVRLTQIAAVTRHVALGLLLAGWLATTVGLVALGRWLIPPPHGLLVSLALVLGPVFVGIPVGVWAMTKAWSLDLGAESGAATTLVAELTAELERWAASPRVVNVVL
jgi:hypothetical protein